MLHLSIDVACAEICGYSSFQLGLPVAEFENAALQLELSVVVNSQSSPIARSRSPTLLLKDVYQEETVKF